MKQNKKSTHTKVNSATPRKRVTGNSLRKQSDYVNRHVPLKKKCSTRKLFSLQHRTINLLRKADHFKNELCKSSVRLSNVSSIQHRENINAGSNVNIKHFKKKLKLSDHPANVQAGSENVQVVAKQSKMCNKVPTLSTSSLEYNETTDTNRISHLDNKNEHNINVDSSVTAVINKKRGIKKSRNLKQDKETSERDLDSVDTEFVENDIDEIITTTEQTSLCDVGHQKHKKKKKYCNDVEYSENYELNDSNDGNSKDNEDNIDNISSEDAVIDYINKHMQAEEIESKRISEDHKSFPNMHFYQFNRAQVLLTLVHPCSLCFVGVLDVKVVIGSVKVLGCTLDRFSGNHTVYSPQGVSCLPIVTESCSNFDETAVSELKKFDIRESEINYIKEKFRDNITILILKKDEAEIQSTVWRTFIRKYADISLTPSIKVRDWGVQKALECKFIEEENLPTVFSEVPEWDHIFETTKLNDSRTIICGGKDVGKSTMLRYLVNRRLSLSKKVLVLDFDPGQSEFTVPGCISACLVTAPLLGPNFSHLQTPIRSIFLGTVNVVENLKYYFVCAEDIISFCNSSKSLRKIPWLINTMGFNKGIGVLITASIIKKVAPTTLIQIQSKQEIRNFKNDLTPEFVEANILNLSISASDTASLNYDLFVIPTAVQDDDELEGQRTAFNKRGISPATFRNIMILSYFGQMLNSNVPDIYSIEPYVVNLSDTQIKVDNGNLTGSAILDAVNGNLVALCNIPISNERLNVCLGFGIVRAVNKETEQLFLLTPLGEDKLNQVNCLIKSDVSLPKRLYTHPSDNLKGHVPYVTYSTNVWSNTVKKTKRFHTIDE